MLKWVVIATTLCGVSAAVIALPGSQDEWQIIHGHHTVDLVQKSTDPFYGDGAPELNIHCEKDHNRVSVGGGRLVLGSDDTVIVFWRGEHGGGSANKVARTGNTAVFQGAEATKLLRDMFRERTVVFRIMGYDANYDVQFSVGRLEAIFMKQAPVCKPMLS